VIAFRLRSILRRGALCLAALLLPGPPAGAQVIAVPLPQASPPTQTFLWASPGARATLVMIPGGEGRLGLAPDRTDLRGFYGNVLKPLSNPQQTSGTLDVVVFDSPAILPVGNAYPASRASSDHLRRIESVVAFYKLRSGKPVWLMGHSNGAISVAEFLRKFPGQVAGAVFSSSRIGVKLPATPALPVLFLHHASEGCAKADPSGDRELSDSLQASGRSDVEFVWIRGGQAEAGNPCSSGFHMFYGAEAEAYRAIDSFIARHSPAVSPARGRP